MEWYTLILTGILGAGIAYIYCSKKYTQEVEKSRSENVELKAKLQAREEEGSRMAERFKALSTDALQSNNALFLDLARERFEQLQARAEGSFSKKEDSIKHMLGPIKESLGRFDEKVQGLEKAREGAYVSIRENIEHLNETHRALQKETQNLSQALKKPHVRGRWGEMQLKRAVEVSGMTEHVDFVEQASVGTETGALRPDMVIRLPNARNVIVDAKASIAAYMEALETEGERERKECIERHVRHIRTHIQQLSGKSYWKQFEQTPEFVVMFIPGEAFFSAALEVDGELLEYASGQNIVLATPTTLIALLKTVAYGWKQDSVAQEAKAICDLGNTLYERVGVVAKHITDVGKHLDKSVGAYNKAVNSMETRFLPTARKFAEMRALGDESIGALQPVERIAAEARAQELVSE